LWNRLFDKDRVKKEFLEAIPVLDAVKRLVQNSSNSSSTPPKKYTIVDLASGKGML
jgi:hypothetical protein